MKIFLQATIVSAFFVKSSFGADLTFELKNRNLSAGVNAPIFDSQGVPLAGTNYLAELYGAETPQSLTNTTGYIGGNRLIVPFRIQGYLDSPGNLSVVKDVVGGLAWLQLRAWDARLGGTYEEAVARGLGGYGESPLFYALGGGQGGGPSLPGPLIGLKSFKLRAATGVLMRSIQRQADRVTIEWLGGFSRYQLQQSAGVDMPWENLGPPTTETRATNQIDGNIRLFRIIGFIQ